MNEKVFVTGAGGPAGKSVLSYLNLQGFSTVGADMREIPSPADSFYTLPAVGHPLFLASLLRVIEQEKPGLFIPTVQEELPLVARIRGAIEAGGCRVFISSASAVEIAHDKLKTARFAADHDIPAPRTFDTTTSREVVLKELGLPLLAKPCIGRGGRGVTVYRTAEEVYRETRENIIFQEFIPGEEFDVNLFVDRGGNVPEFAVLKKTKLKEEIVGNALAVERTERKSVLGVGIRAARSLELEGPLDMDIRLRNDGTPVLLEINARIGGNVLSAPEILGCLIRRWRLFPGIRIQ